MESFKTIPPIYDFVLKIEKTEEKVKDQELTDLIEFLRIMNIQHSFKQMPGKPIKLNIPIQLKQPDPLKSKSRAKLNTNGRLNGKTKSKDPVKGSLLGNHEDEERYAERRSTKESKELYYFNNKPEFIKQIREMLSSIKETHDDASCDKESKSFSPLAHQLIVQRYLNITTPYRGLLFYHGLGSGKTCSSISIIEGMVQDKKVFIMTPASLQANYRTQMRFCGNQIFRNNNHWIFKKLSGEKDFKPLFDEMGINETYFDDKIKALGLKNRGLWLTIPGQPNNYEEIDAREKDTLDEQIELMIKEKYNFINFNGIRNEKWDKITKQGKNNPFNNSIIVIDEAHNFVSRIVNKLQSKTPTVSIKMYHAIMEAENCRVVLLTGTPFINYPSELGTLFNLIHGYNVVLAFKLSYKPGAKALNEKNFKQIFQDDIIDSVEYSAPYLKFTKTPFGFIKVAGKMVYNERGDVYYDDFKKYISGKINSIDGLQIIDSESKFYKYKLLPDISEEFDKYFLEGDNIKNKDFFQKKILGMVSYVGDNKKLMPDIVKSTEKEKGPKGESKIVQSDIHVEYVEMSKHQIDEYSRIRDQEREQEKSRRKRMDTESNSTYRVFSRACCNFAFPSEQEDRRPMPGGSKEKLTEDALDAITDEEKMNDIDGKYDEVDLVKKNDLEYIKAIQNILKRFDESASSYFDSNIPKLTSHVFDLLPNNLPKYSPKFYKILKNIMDPDNIGCHLLYTNFRKLEGIGILRLILLYYGYCELKVVKEGDAFKLNIMSKYDKKSLIEMRCFSLYTGTETAEEKEIIRNIYNNNYGALPNSIQMQLLEKFPHPDRTGEIIPNTHGQVIQLLMITASGAEGIDLKNTRFVHITEPYWHHVRINQVIGRARRICSHTQLEKELQDVTVFMYISYFGEIDLDGYPHIRDSDKGESTDMKLYQIMKRKEKVSSIFLNVLKESAIDCKYNCFTTKNKTEFLTEQDYSQEKLTAFKKTTRKLEYSQKTLDGIKYVTLEIKNPDGTREGDITVYNFEDYAKLKEYQGMKDRDALGQSGAEGEVGPYPVGFLIDDKLQKI